MENNNLISTNNCQWVIHINDNMHIVELKSKGELYIDRKYVDKIKVNTFMNAEYQFKVENTNCSIVKLVTDKAYNLVVNGEYLNIKRKYIPLSPPIFTTYIFSIVDIVALLIFTILNYYSDIEYISKIFYQLIFTGFGICVAKAIKLLGNCPCKIKNTLLNKLFRLFCLIIVEVIYGGVFSVMVYLVY